MQVDINIVTIKKKIVHTLRNQITQSGIELINGNQ